MNEEFSYLTKDDRWDGWLYSSMDYFQKVITNIQIDQAVPKDVVERFQIIKKLILHSYFVYEFLDVAMESTLLTFELALRLRYKELLGEPPKKDLGLYDLIKWGSKRGLFEENEPAIDSLRRLRNSLAHPKGYQLFGHLALNVIQSTAEIINGLYDDVNLRKNRKHEEESINRKFTNFIKSGAILELLHSRIIIFSANLLYYKNTVSPPKYYLLFWPLFDPKPRNGSIDICEPIFICASSLGFEKEFVLIKTSPDQQEIKIHHIIKELNIKKFAKWKREFEVNEFGLQHYLSYKIGELRSQARRM